jgi:hypothetical protein
MTLTLLLGFFLVFIAIALYVVRRYQSQQELARQREYESLMLMRAAAEKQKAQAAAPTPVPVAAAPAPAHAATAALSAAQILAQPGLGGAQVQYQQADGGPATAVLADQAALLDAGDTYPQPVVAPQSRPASVAGLPMRELAIALYEARGYRRETALKEDAPILCFLQHRTEPNRAYGFVALQSTDPVGRERVKGIARDLRTAGHKRIIMYASAGFAPEAIELAETLRIRMYGPAEIMQMLTQLPPHVRTQVVERAKQRAPTAAATVY